MSGGANNDLGSVVALWLSQVKSMMGEELNRSDLGKRGLVGDRVYAIVDSETGKVAGAKHPKSGRISSRAMGFAPSSPAPDC